jgi:NAD(P)-dependent dehydrogenase (short-subunit alcohol dehydrogenase family)
VTGTGTSPLAGRRALVTGGAIRVGRSLSLKLADMGLDVAVHFHRSAGPAAATAEECRARGVRAVTLAGDLGRADECRRVVAEAEEALGGGLDVLVNSASNFLHAPFADVTEEDVDAALAVNLKGPFFCAQAAAPGMRRRGFGRIVNLADVAGLEPWPRFIAHSMAKAGLVMLTEALAQELAPHVTVNAIAPGPVLMPAGSSPAAVRRSEEKTVLKRIGSPDDVAGALAYLLEADFVTGHTLVVDGGRLVRP